MKKLVLSLLVVLFTVSVVFAASIVRVVDPTSQKEIWTTEVYNNYTTALSPGDVVVWDIGSSTGDNDNYVTSTNTADTSLVAGVVYPSTIAIGGIGTIAIYGTVDVDQTAANTVDDVLCTSSTQLTAADCTDDTYGFCVVTEAADPGKCFINPRN